MKYPRSSTHVCRTSKPLATARASRSAGLYLCEYSVRIDSPSANENSLPPTWIDVYFADTSDGMAWQSNLGGTVSNIEIVN